MNDVPFRATNYDYKVSLGVVMDRDAISWSHTVRCDNWDDVNAVVQMWSDTRDNPAVEVDADYIPHRIPDGD